MHCNNEIHSHLKMLQNMFVWHCYCIVGIRDKSDFIYLFFPYSIPVLWRTFGLNFQLYLMIFCSNHQMFLLYMAVQIGCLVFFIVQFNRCVSFLIFGLLLTVIINFWTWICEFLLE